MMANVEMDHLCSVERQEASKSFRARPHTEQNSKQFRRVRRQPASLLSRKLGDKVVRAGVVLGHYLGEQILLSISSASMLARSDFEKNSGTENT